jgi:hypothetical protein
VPEDSLLTGAGEEILENRGAEPDLLVDDTPAISRKGLKNF